MKSGRDARPTRRELLRGAGAGAAGVGVGLARVGGGVGVAGAAGAAGVAGAALLAAAAPASAQTSAAPQPVSVVDRLQRLIRIESLQLFCYRHILATGVLTPRARRTVAPFVGDEQAHIAALEAALRRWGGRAPAPPPDVATANRYLGHRQIGGRLDQLQGDQDALGLLLTLEQTVIGAYAVALEKLAQPDLVELICSIMACDAQHDAMIGIVRPPFKAEDAVPYGLVGGRR